jgi:hypothetical protein
MGAIDHSNDGYNYSSLPTTDQVVITQASDTGGSSRVMNGDAVDGFFADGTTFETSLNQLTASAYLRGVPVAGVQFAWRSSNPCAIAVDNNGNCTRVTNANASSFDSDGCVSTGQLGGSAQIRAIALRADGSESGVEGLFNVCCQAQAFRQYAATRTNSATASGSIAGSANGYNLVGPQPASDHSN